MMRVVLDTNCLLASLSRRGQFFNVWEGLQKGQYILCVSNGILDEYEEIIAQKTNSVIASNVIQTLINSRYVELIDPHFHFGLVKADDDDNKFTDCALAANATFIVSNDGHFKGINSIPFPQLCVILLEKFSELLRK